MDFSPSTDGGVKTGGEVGMRLIDAYALQNMIHKSKMENPHKDAKVANNHELEHDHFMQMVVLQPTVQEEIVRCKDCKYWDSKKNECHNTCSYMQYRPCFSKWFCADGEKG